VRAGAALHFEQQNRFALGGKIATGIVDNVIRGERGPAVRAQAFGVVFAARRCGAVWYFGAAVVIDGMQSPRMRILICARHANAAPRLTGVLSAKKNGRRFFVQNFRCASSWPDSSDGEGILARVQRC